MICMYYSLNNVCEESIISHSHTHTKIMACFDVNVTLQVDAIDCFKPESMWSSIQMAFGLSNIAKMLIDQVNPQGVIPESKDIQKYTVM